MINKLEKFMLEEYSYNLGEHKIFRSKRIHYIPIFLLFAFFIFSVIAYILGEISFLLILFGSTMFFFLPIYGLIYISGIIIITPKYIIIRNKLWRFDVINFDKITEIDCKSKSSKMYKGFILEIKDDEKIVNIDLEIYAGDLSFLDDIFVSKGLIENENDELIKKDIEIKIVNDSVKILYK